MKNIRHIILLVLATLALVPTLAAKPKVVVNIVVGGMCGDDLTRYSENFSDKGFNRLTSGGAVYAECYSDFIPNTHLSALATIASGTLPSMHGVIADKWYDRSNNNAIVTLGRKKGEVRCNARDGINSGFTADHIAVQTLAEAVVESHSKSRSITVAQSANSAILLAGRASECYWIDDRGRWCSADCYTNMLPSWVTTYNETDFNSVFVTGSWFGQYPKSRYLNSRKSDILVYDVSTKVSKNKNEVTGWAEQLATTPAGNGAVLEFAKKAFNHLLHEKRPGENDILNICLDASRNIAQKYGSDSIEYEDMLYRLDTSLGEFLDHVFAQVKSKDDVVIVLTSDRGSLAASTYDLSNKYQFNRRQTEVILNAFLSARYGQGNWVLGCHDNSIYLNRNTIYSHKLTLKEIETEAAAFAIQFRGIANALTAEAMLSGSFVHGTARLMQNTFYAQRSGDVSIVLQPLHIDNEQPGLSSGSPYNYDRHVPLVIYGGGIASQRIDRRVSTTSIAPTIASLLGVKRPMCSDAEILTEVKK